MSDAPPAKRPIWVKQAAARVWEAFPTVRGLRRAIRDAVGDQSALEIGCGFGVNAAHLPGPYVGLDVDERIIAKARALRPGKRFLVGGARDHVDTLAGTPIVFFALVIHELPVADREGVLRAAARIAGEQILVFDFDPGMSAAAKWRLGLLEERTLDAYWGFDLPAFMATQGWSTCDRRSINRLFCRWKFSRSPAND